MHPSFPPLYFRPGPDLHSLAAVLVGAIAPDQFAAADRVALVQNARTHNLAPMLYWQLNRQGVNLNLPEWQTLRAARTQALRDYLQRQAAFQTFSNALERANIPAIWLKGFALAHIVYPHPILRPMRDLDVLVPYAQREQALAIAQELGYVLDVWPLSDAVQEMSHHYHLRSSVVVELHYRLLGVRSKMLTPEQLTWFWTQTESFQHDDLHFTLFQPEATLLYLAVHAILQHGEFELLLQRYLDLYLLLKKYPQLDWTRIVERAVAFRWTYALARALELTREYFGTSLPDGLLPELTSRRPNDEDYSHARWLRPDTTRLEATRNLMHGMTGAEKWKWFWASLFPTPKYMRWRYAVRADWQLPLFYFWRWGMIAVDTFQTMLKWPRNKST